jgi:hypothetical protein
MHAGRLIVVAGLAGLALAVLVSAGPASTSAGDSCTRWRSVPSPKPPDAESTVLEGVDAQSPTDAWAVGWYQNRGYANEYTYAQHWNGKAWAYVTTPNPPPVADSIPFNRLHDVVALSSADAWAVGYDNSRADYLEEPLAEHWDGRQWSIVDIPAHGIGRLYGVDGSSSKDVWAVGQWFPRRGARHAIVLHWDGTAWRAVRLPKRARNGGSLYALDVLGRRNAWAVGAWSWGRRPLVLHWNGRKWQLVRLPRAIKGELDGIAMLSPKSGWAVGTMGSPLAIHWNGRRWKRVPAPQRYPSSEDRLQAVGVLPGGAAWAVGYGKPYNEFDQMIVQRWNGRRWRNTEFKGQQGGWLNDVSRLTRRDGWVVGTRFYLIGDDGGYGPLTERLGRC